MQRLELVTFRTPAVEAERFIAENAEINDWLKRQPGFILRHLAASEDGSWVDVVLWDNKEAGDRAAAKLLVEMADCPAMVAIDPASIAMSHADIRMSIR